MSIKIMSSIWSSRDLLSATEKLVLLKIADCAADDGSHAYPSLSTIAAECTMSRQGVVNAISRLVDKDALQKQARKKGGTNARRSNYYTVNVELINSHIPPATQSPKVVNKIDHQVKRADIEGKVVVNEVDQVVNEVDQVVNDVYQGSQRRLPDPSSNHHLNKNNNVGSLKYIDEGAVDKHQNGDEAVVVVSEKEHEDRAEAKAEVAAKAKAGAPSAEIEALARECDVSNVEAMQLATKYGNERLVEQLKNLAAMTTRKGVRSPVAYITASLIKNFKPNAESPVHQEQRRDETGNRQVSVASHRMYDEERQARDNTAAEKLCTVKDWRDEMREEFEAKQRT